MEHQGGPRRRDLCRRRARRPAALRGVACVATVGPPSRRGARDRHAFVLSYRLVVLVGIVAVGRPPPCGAGRTPGSSSRTQLLVGSAIGLSWVLTVHLAQQQRGDAGAAEALASSWHAWVLALLTASVASPWLRLRRVPVSRRAVLLARGVVRLDHGVTPAFASAVGISRSPCASGTSLRRDDAGAAGIPAACLPGW